MLRMKGKSKAKPMKCTYCSNYVIRSIAEEMLFEMAIQFELGGKYGLLRQTLAQLQKIKRDRDVHFLGQPVNSFLNPAINLEGKLRERPKAKYSYLHFVPLAFSRQVAGSRLFRLVKRGSVD